MKFPLTQGAYTARGLIANAQTCLNLYPEPNPPDAPFPVTHYPTPGLQHMADFSLSGTVRGLYWASDRNLYGVIGSAVFRLLGDWSSHSLGTLPSVTNQRVSMSDNGTTLVIVDGSTGGWTVDLASGAFAAIADDAFYGSDRVDFIDTYLIFHKPDTPSFYISNSNAVTFNPLYFAEKIGYNDILVSIASLHGTIWLFGNVTTEIWINSGASDFPFQRIPGGIIEQGCIAWDSVAVADNAVFWLSQDRNGRNMVMRGEGYTAQRVSNFAVEDAFNEYPYVADATGMIYQDGGHEFYVLTFGVQNVTWVYDATTRFWHQRSFNDNGADIVWLPSCIAFWNSGVWDLPGTPPSNNIVAGSRWAPQLFLLSRDTYTDYHQPIRRVRAWPHALNEQKRLSHTQFVAALTGTNLAPDQVSLRWSDDGGQTFGDSVIQTTNNASNGQYSWRRLGMARDRVYELSWTAAGETALNGAWLEAVPAET